MYNYENIKEELKKRKYNVFLIKDNHYKLILTFTGKKKELIDILKKQYKNDFDDNYFIIYKFSFHTGLQPLQGGPLAVKISTIKNDFIRTHKNKNIIGRVWFQKKFLEKNGWDDSYFDNMTKKLISGKVKLLPLIVNMYNVKF
jgi:hypothetical protein